MRAAVRAKDPVPFRLHDGIEVDWEDSPNGSDEGLLRFLQARGGDVEKAAEMFVRQLKWRRRAFPIFREGKVAEILDEALPHKERRYAKMGTNSEGLPVIKQDLMWGRLVTERYSALDCVRAYLLFLEENVIMAPTFLERQMVVVSYGGFCPADWGKSVASILQDNYPERLVRAVVWPVPSFLCRTVRTFVLLFVPKETNAKISIESEEGAMLERTKLQASQMHDYMTGGLSAIVQRDRPDAAVMKKLIVDGFRNRGRNSELEGWPPREANPATPAVRAASSSAGLQADASVAGCLAGVASSLCGCWSRGDEVLQETPQPPRRMRLRTRSKEAHGAGPQTDPVAFALPEATKTKAAAAYSQSSLGRSLLLAAVLLPVLISWFAPALRAL